MFFRSIFLSFLVVGVFGAMKCNGRMPLRDVFGIELSCKFGGMIPPHSLPTDSVTYMAMAASGDLYEIQSGQIGLLRGGTMDLRNFAQMLIIDHTQTTATLKAAAASAGLLPPAPALSAMHLQMISELQLSGANFDQVFWQQQMIAHQMALNLHSNYAAHGDVASLRAAAASAVPIVQMHLNQIKAMPVLGGSCPANFWCHSDIDEMGLSFAACCPDLSISTSFTSPFFSASFSMPPIYPTTPIYRPIYNTLGF